MKPKPIIAASAPPVDEPVLLFSDGSWVVGYYDNIAFCYLTEPDGRELSPTHWLPLPPDPS